MKRRVYVTASKNLKGAKDKRVNTAKRLRLKAQGWRFSKDVP